jgi:hypothetical protein
MIALPKMVEDWTLNDCQILLDNLLIYYKKYNVENVYVIGSRCNGLDDPHDIDVSLDVSANVISWRELNMLNNAAELLKRAISEKKLYNTYGEKFNVILGNETRQLNYKTIEKFDMPYFNLKEQKLYNKIPHIKFPYKIITQDYDNHIFYMKLRKENLTPDEIIFYTNMIYEKLSPVIYTTLQIGDSEKSFMLSSPYNIVIYLTNLAIGKKDLQQASKEWIKNNSGILKTADYKTMSVMIQKGLNTTNSDLFVKLFHDCEIYENLSVF